ncbi:MAG: hypothetical protein KC777_12370, partial [Cyanobacteria bacterium HKST-UBA02]|nr:hypothetical protein [Cyanobacteria bacterium HKST-UBA02]
PSLDYGIKDPAVEDRDKEHRENPRPIQPVPMYRENNVSANTMLSTDDLCCSSGIGRKSQRLEYRFQLRTER